MMVKRMGSGVWAGKYPPALPLASCRTLGKLPNLSMLPFPYLLKGINMITHTVVVRIDFITCIKYLEQHLTRVC